MLRDLCSCEQRRKTQYADDDSNAMHIQDGGEDVKRILSAIDEPLIAGVILGDESTKKTVYEFHQMNRESKHRRVE